MIKNTILMMLSVVLSGATVLPQKVTETSLAVASMESRQAIEFETRSQRLENDYNAIIKEKQAIEAENQRQLMLQKQAEIDYIISENARKNNVTFNPYDVTVESGITVDELYQTLSAFNNGALAKFAWVLKDVENSYGINCFFMAALIAQESGWVTSYRAIYQNNLTGHAVYNSNAVGTYFNSQEESIYNTAELLYNNYLSPNGHNYYGTSIWNVNTDYCLTEDSSVTDYEWSENITSIANDFVEHYHSDVKHIQEVPTLQ